MSYPSAEILLDLHNRFPELDLKAFAIAVVRHCESPPSGKRTNYQVPSRFLSEEEKDSWFSTAAGQLWLKHHEVPSIMRHARKDLLNGRNSISTAQESDSKGN